MAVRKSATDNNIQIHELKQGEVKLRMIGQTPLYFKQHGIKSHA